MPEVNGVRYPYTPQGKKQAAEAQRKSGQQPGFDFRPGWDSNLPPMGSQGPMSPTDIWSNAPLPISEPFNPLPGYGLGGLPTFTPPMTEYPITPAPVHEAPIPPLEAELMPMPPQIPLTTRDLNMPIPGTANTNQVPTFPNSMPLGKMPGRDRIEDTPKHDPPIDIWSNIPAPKQDWNKSTRYTNPNKIGGFQ